jgi:hypothetical protein
MNLEDIISRARAAQPKQFADIPDARAKVIVRSALAEIVKAVGAGGAEPVRVPGLGVFRTTIVDREKDGKRTAVKRTVFRAAEAK